MFVVLTVIVVITMLGFMGLSMAQHDVTGSGDLIDARSTENAAYTGLNLALARLEVDPAQTRVELAKFLADSTATNPRQWLDFAPASGKSFELVASPPTNFSTKGTSGLNQAVQVRVVSMDVGDAGGLPLDGMKITLQSIGTGRSGENLSTVASYRLLGLDVARITVTTSTGRPTHALYLGGELQNANGSLKTDGSVYISGDYKANNGFMTIKGKLKVGGNVDLPSGNPMTIDSNTWVGGSLNVNTGNNLVFKQNLGVGGGLCTMNDNLQVDSSLNIYGSCGTSLSWQSGKSIRVNGKQFFLRDQLLMSWGTPVRQGHLAVKNGNAFLWTGLLSADADPSSNPSDSIHFLQFGANSSSCGGVNSYAGRSIVADSVYVHSLCNFSMRTSGQVFKVNGSARIGKMSAGTLNITGKGWSYSSANVPTGATASGGWTYGGADNIVLPKAPVGLIQLGYDSIDTIGTIAKNPPNQISLSASMAPKIQKISAYKVKAGVTSTDLGKDNTAKYINRMIDTATKYGDLYNGYLLLWIDEAVNIYEKPPLQDKIKGKVMFIVDNVVKCSWYWPPSANSNAIQIIYIPKAQTVHGLTFTGNGDFFSQEFGIHYGNFYGYIYAEKLLSTKVKFDTQIHGAMAYTVSGSRIEHQPAENTSTNSGMLEIQLDQAVFNDINTYLGIIKDPGSASATPVIKVSHSNGLVSRQSRLQAVPIGEYR